MNRGLNLPAIQKIMNEFEKESSMMDMKEEMMSDAVDDVMEDDLEDEEEEGDKILKEVLDEIGVDLSQQVSAACLFLVGASSLTRAYYHRSSRMRRLELPLNLHRSQTGAPSPSAKAEDHLITTPRQVDPVVVEVECQMKMHCKHAWMHCGGHDCDYHLVRAVRGS